MAKGQGQAPHEPTDKIRSEINALRTYGVPIKEVAKYIGIDDKTMYKYYREELENSALKANARVGKFLYEAASGAALDKGASHSDCLRSAMFWAKTRMGWRESGELEQADKADIDRVIEVVRATRPN